MTPVNSLRSVRDIEVSYTREPKSFSTDTAFLNISLISGSITAEKASVRTPIRIPSIPLSSLALKSFIGCLVVELSFGS